MRVVPTGCRRKYCLNRMEYSRKLMQPSIQKRCIVRVLLISILLFLCLHIAGPYYCQLRFATKKVEYVCIEDPETHNTTGLENLKPLHIFFRDGNNHVFSEQHFYNFSRRKYLNFTPSETNRITSCINDYPTDFWKGHEDFWSGTQQEIRRTHHTYLVPGENIIVEVGGNVGEDAQVFLDTYKPKYYVMLEPLKLLYRRLQQRFANYTNVITYNFGLGAGYEKFMIRMEGNEGDASSPFLGSGEGTCSMKVVNATDFFRKLGVGNFKIDLITINCEGCEYDLLETLLSTDLILQFKHIQFATHSKLKNLHDPVNRYCQLQEMLSRSHKLTYQYKFQWETWKLKDV